MVSGYVCMYVCLEKRDADRQGTTRTDGRAGAGRGLRETERPRIRAMRGGGRQQNDHAAPCPAQSTAAKPTVMRMIIRKMLFVTAGWRRRGVALRRREGARERIILVDHHTTVDRGICRIIGQRLCLLVT
jgi:hypothetical protein